MIFMLTDLSIQVKPDKAEGVMNPVFEKLGLSYGFLKSAFQGEEDRFVPSGFLASLDVLRCFETLRDVACSVRLTSEKK